MSNVLRNGEWHRQKESSSFGELGLFARYCIPKGQRIFSEMPCFTIEGTNPSPPDVYTKRRGIYNSTGKVFAGLESGLLLPARDQDMNHLDEAGKAAVGASPNRLAVFRHLISKSQAGPGSASNTRPLERQKSIEEAATLVGIFEQNRFLLYAEVAGGKAQWTGFFLRAARLNHSCQPNCYASWDADSQQLCLHAIVQIHQGDELTIMYHERFLAFCPQALRHRRLKDDYGFDCRCPACEQTVDGQVCEKASRKTAEGLAKYGLLTSSDVSRETAFELVKIGMGLSVGLDMQKIETWSRGLVYICRAQWLNLRWSREDAVEQLRRARNNASACFGENGAVTKRIENVLQQAKQSDMNKMELNDLIVGLTATANEVQAEMAASSAQTLQK